MAQDPTAPLTKQHASAANSRSKATKTTSTLVAQQSSRLARLSHIVTGVCTLAAAIATATNLGLVQLMESKAQSLFFELRGPVAPPENIVIVAIDEPSLSQKQYYQQDPHKYAYLEPLKAWPWKRTAYAEVIERLISAGARSVALDVILDAPSSYGTADDQRLAQVLQRYRDRVTLAAEYTDGEMHQGNSIQLTQPEPLLRTEPIKIGSVNFPLEPDGKIHRLASEYTKQLIQDYGQQAQDFDVLRLPIPSFDEAALQSAQINPSRGSYIYFYGPQGTFKQISFADVIDPNNWNSYLQQGKYFKDKIVLIGGTAQSQQDFHPTPLSESWRYPNPMSGVEIHANAIATLMQGRALAQAVPNLPLRGVLVLVEIAGAGMLLSRLKKGLTRLIWVTGIVIAWGGISYVSFVHGRLMPTAVPVLAIALSGFSYLATGSFNNHLRKLHLRRTLERHLDSPVVQEIISQQDDLQDLLRERELAIFGKVIGGHYKIVKVLGSGGFSETYIAQDTRRPSNPLCVVKQLRPANKKPQHLELARRLFQLEAETLERLGTHDQIPRLFAHFEEDEEFYLVQELVVGHPLSQELQRGKPMLEAKVIQILQDLLQILDFVHTHNVIHRDIKPSNIIRRYSDGKLVLIDFGTVKEVTTGSEGEGKTSFTIGIGTEGYAPNEQCAGRPRFNSDIYAVGIIGIKALTGVPPQEFQVDPKTGEFLWQDKAQVSPELAAILSKMVLHDFTRRYQSVSEVRLALDDLLFSTSLDDLPTNILSAEDFDNSTAPWEGATGRLSD